MKRKRPIKPRKAKARVRKRKPRTYQLAYGDDGCEMIAKRKPKGRK